MTANLPRPPLAATGEWHISSVTHPRGGSDIPISRKRFPACPIERTLSILSGRWKAMLVWQLLDAPKRYRDLERAVDGIAQRVLTQALRELEEDGVVQRHDDHWALTEMGTGLGTALSGMWDWGTAHAAAYPRR